MAQAVQHNSAQLEAVGLSVPPVTVNESLLRDSRDKGLSAGGGAGSLFHLASYCNREQSQMSYFKRINIKAPC